MNGTCHTSKSTEELKSKSPSVRHLTRLRFGLRTLLIVTMVVCVLLAASTWVVHKGEESHARSCLVTISELADDTIRMSIPKKDYRNAIEAAEYIKTYYPPAVLPKDHPFAQEYEAERQRQIQRIHNALRTAVGDEHPTVWREWKEAVDEIVIVVE